MIEKCKRVLIPDAVKNPVLLFWVNIVPQVILLLLNIKAFWVISEEVADDKIWIAYLFLFIEVLLIALSVLGWLFLKNKNKLINWKWNLIFLFSSISYLWIFTSFFWDLMPTTIEPWILDTSNVMLSQFAFIMPAIFYSMLCLSCFKHNNQPPFLIFSAIIIEYLTPHLYIKLSIF